MLERWRRSLARMIAPAPAPKTSTRMYAGAKSTLRTGGFGSYANTSADAELESSLTQLRARSRQLMRDAPYAKRARVVVVNNVVGTGVGLQAQVKTTRGELNARVNDSIEAAWKDWCCAEYCHTGGAMHFSDLERMGLGEVFTAGEFIVRMHPVSFGGSKVPFALEVIEPERLADGFNTPEPSSATGNEVRMGVEIDRYHRAVAYWIRERHPGDLRSRPGVTDRVVRVPAEQILHVRLVDRWPQTRGEPWLHSVLRKLNDMDQYSQSELEAARASAAYFATIKSPEAEQPGVAEGEDGTKQLNIEPLTISQLSPGDELEFHAPNRPNTALDPFLRYMLREVAAGTGVSYGALSRDRSQANYSSERIDLLDDRDLWRVLQQWWIRAFRERLHKFWMQQAVLSRVVSAITVEQYALNPEALTAVRWKARGWSWVDPTKEVDAFKEAVRAGFITVSQVIAQTGGGVDLEDYITERKAELEALEAAGINVDTTVPDAVAVAPAAPVAAAAQAAPADDTTPDNPDDAKPARLVSIAR